MYNVIVQAQRSGGAAMYNYNPFFCKNETTTYCQIIIETESLRTEGRFYYQYTKFSLEKLKILNQYLHTHENVKKS